MSFSFQGTNPRRRKLTPPPLKRGKPSWKIVGEKRSEQPPWRLEADKKGKQTITQVVPPAITASMNPDNARSRFTVEITDGCMVGGFPTQPGDIILCFADQVGCVIGRGKIISEEKNAF